MHTNVAETDSVAAKIDCLRHSKSAHILKERVSTLKASPRFLEISLSDDSTLLMESLIRISGDVVCELLDESVPARYIPSMIFDGILFAIESLSVIPSDWQQKKSVSKIQRHIKKQLCLHTLRHWIESEESRPISNISW